MRGPRVLSPVHVWCARCQVQVLPSWKGVGLPDWVGVARSWDGGQPLVGAFGNAPK
jgi:hypothetical protein